MSTPPDETEGQRAAFYVSPSGARAEIASLETRLVRWMIGTVIATATSTVAIVRLMG